MPLDPQMQRILDTVSQVMERRRKESAPERTGAVAERVGLRSPQVAQAEFRSADLSDQQSQELLAQLLMQQRGEERQDMLTEEEWERNLGLNRMQAADQMRYLQTQIQASAEEAQKSRDFTAERQDIQWDRQEDMMAQQKKDASKAAWTKLLTSAGLGAITGGIAPAAMGASSWLGGAALGGAMGGQSAGQMVGQSVGRDSMLDWYNQYANKYLGGTQ